MSVRGGVSLPPAGSRRLPRPSGSSPAMSCRMRGKMSAEEATSANCPSTILKPLMPITSPDSETSTPPLCPPAIEASLWKKVMPAGSQLPQTRQDPPGNRRLWKGFEFARVADQVHVGGNRNVLPVEQFHGLRRGINRAKHGHVCQQVPAFHRYLIKLRPTREDNARRVERPDDMGVRHQVPPLDQHAAADGVFRLNESDRRRDLCEDLGEGESLRGSRGCRR